MTFKCEACGEFRDDMDISVLKGDMRKKHDLPKGTVTRNVNYCNDRPECHEKAVTILEQSTGEQ